MSSYGKQVDSITKWNAMSCRIWTSQYMEGAPSCNISRSRWPTRADPGCGGKVLWLSGLSLNFGSNSTCTKPQRTDAITPQFEKLGWHVPKHWHSDATVTLEGFLLLYSMLWSVHGTEYIIVLLIFGKTQWTLHQEEIFNTETQEYRNWMNAVNQKGCRGSKGLSWIVPDFKKG